MFIKLFCVLIIIIFSYNAHSKGACQEPSEPSCASNEETYNSKESYAACTKEFESMSKNAKEYIVCLKQELQEEASEVQKKSDKTTEDTNAAIKKFNCKANPKANC